MPPPDPTETELKLALDPQHVERFKQSTALAEATLSEVQIDTVYFDTADALLRRHRMALRVRRADGHWLQTLKTERKGGALSTRGEWETPAHVVRGKGRLDLPRLAESPLPQLLAKQKSAPVLRPLFSTRVRRAQWLLQRADAAIEVALDIGEISTGSGRGLASEPICEVELELKQGEPAALIQLALELLDVKSKAPPELTPIIRSKAERGYQLAARAPAGAVKASARTLTAGLTRSMTSARALRTMVASGIAVLTANAELLLRHDDPEYVHQARVVLRRVRSAIRLIDRKHRDVPRSWAIGLRWLARALGEARDWDVITDETLPALAETAGADAINALVAKADQRRGRARVKIRKAIRSTRYAMLVLNGERWSLSPAPADAARLSDAAAPALQSAAKNLFQSAHFFAALTTENRHEVRIMAKRLRYALDLFAVVLPKQATARYVDALSQLQDVLGEMNDAVVAQSVLPQLSKSPQLEASVREKMAAVEPERIRNVEERLLRLSKLQTPW